MKDSLKPCQHSLADDAVYKEVVVIGNGPSGMVTSFMLAGNVPYLKTIPEDLPIDEMLRARLSNLPEGQSLYETDLMALAEGLEGRSQSPIPLLMDNLLRPCADLGIQADPLIEWKYDIEKQIDHIVLGRGPPGGSWPTFPGNVRTLSPGAWLTLPPHATRVNTRLTARAVAAYCRRYVHACKLQKYFRNNVIVNSVTLAAAGTESCPADNCPLQARYCVAGYEVTTGRSFRYVCSRVVLCGGSGARPNTLEAAPPPLALHTLTDFERALQLLDSQRVNGEGDSESESEGEGGVMVVGGGVSGADAVWATRARRRRVTHVHRGPAPALARLDHNTYPDYTQVYRMMMDGPSGNHPNYTSYPDHVIVDVQLVNPHKITDDLEDYSIQPKRVTLLDLHTNNTTTVTVSIIGVFIGSKPDLSFLQTCNINLQCNCRQIDEQPYRNNWHYFKSILGQSLQSCKSRYLSILDEKCKCEPFVEDKCSCTVNLFQDGLGFGVDPTKPVDSRNPIAIDKSTHEMLNAPKGMYALGPLTGDNFVRFIPGGALAAVAHIHKDK